MSKLRGLTYSMYSDYLKCPQYYYWKFVEKRPMEKPDEPLNRFLGCVWADVFDAIYKEDLLRVEKRRVDAEEVDSKTAVRKTLRRLVEIYKGMFEKYERDISGGRKGIPDPIRWESKKQRKEYYDEGLAVLPLMRKVLVFEDFVDVQAFSEYSMDTVCYNRVVNGRADLIVERYPFKDGKMDLSEAPKVYIVDAKGTAEKNVKYLCDDQLYWYSYLYYAKTGRWPDYLGFVLLRLGAVKWIPATNDKLKAFLGRLKDVLVAINSERWEATPDESKGCKFCEYKASCPEYREMRRQVKLQEKPSELIGVDDGFGKDIVIV